MYGDYTKQFLHSAFDDGEVATVLEYNNAIGAEESTWIMPVPITVSRLVMQVVTDFGSVTTAPAISLIRKAKCGGGAGTDASSTTAAFMTDSGFTASEFIGWTIYNITNASSGIITANTTTTVTAAMYLDSDGTTADLWDSGDYYVIGYKLATVVVPTGSVAGDTIYAKAANTIVASGAGLVAGNINRERGVADIYAGEQLGIYSTVLGVGSSGQFHPVVEYSSRPEHADNMTRYVESA